MNAVTVSTKYQIVIPLKVREQMRVKPGQRMHVIAYDNMLILIPVRHIREARGSLKGLETNIKRDEQDRI